MVRPDNGKNANDQSVISFWQRARDSAPPIQKLYLSSNCQLPGALSCEQPRVGTTIVINRSIMRK
ncbi:hypothetical protein SPHINGOR109_10298 [Sphingorhabdus sp. 109]|nr:hypothetical protein SPHINGOR109_10298 [Sphingorhabdus sp. 109]